MRTKSESAQRPPKVGEQCVARKHNAKLIHVAGKTASLCGLWSLAAMSVPGPASKRWQLPLCRNCARVQDGGPTDGG